MITWDFKSSYKSVWIFDLLIVWHFKENWKLDYLSIGNWTYDTWWNEYLERYGNDNNLCNR